jgi:hypothetical protein
VHLLLTQCLREFLAGVKRRATFSQVFEFQTSFGLLFCSSWVDTCLRRAAARIADGLLVTAYVRAAFISGGQAQRAAKALRNRSACLPRVELDNINQPDDRRLKPARLP